MTNAVSWRTDGVKYRKNEVFLDVIESVNLLAGASGNVLRSEIVGAIKMRVYLSGMPELRLGLNDKVLFESTGRGKSKSVELEDTKFHQCVRLSRFDNDRTISFIPPDGEFELMSYRLNTHVSKRMIMLSYQCFLLVQSLTKAIVFELFYYINGYFRVYLTFMNIYSFKMLYLPFILIKFSWAKSHNVFIMEKSKFTLLFNTC